MRDVASHPKLSKANQLSQLKRPATDFAAYLLIVSAAVAVTVVVLMSSVSGAVRWLDMMGRPNAVAQSNASPPAPVHPSKVGRGNVQTASFAMLPSAMPIQMRDDVMSSNF